jgi:hypothetical protein
MLRKFTRFPSGISPLKLPAHKLLETGADLDSSLTPLRFGIRAQAKKANGLPVLIITLPQRHFQGI